MIEFFILLAILGCGKEQAKSLPSQLPQNNTSTLMDRSEDGTVYLYGRKFKEEEIEKERSQYTASDLSGVFIGLIW